MFLKSNIPSCLLSTNDKGFLVTDGGDGGGASSRGAARAPGGIPTSGNTSIRSHSRPVRGVDTDPGNIAVTGGGAGDARSRSDGARSRGDAGAPGGIPTTGSTRSRSHSGPVRGVDKDPGIITFPGGGGNAGSRDYAGAPRSLDEDPGGIIMTTPLPSPTSSVASSGEESGLVNDFLNSLRRMTPTFQNPLNILKDNEGGHLNRNHADWSTIETTAGILGRQDDVDDHDAKPLSNTTEDEE